MSYTGEDRPADRRDSASESDEIEITSAMIEAGVAAMSRSHIAGDEDTATVARVFQAMTVARVLPVTPVELARETLQNIDGALEEIAACRRRVAEHLEALER
jgi:hypothetical protein